MWKAQLEQGPGYNLKVSPLVANTHHLPPCPEGSIISQNITTNWGSSVQIYGPMENITFKPYTTTAIATNLKSLLEQHKLSQSSRSPKWDSLRQNQVVKGAKILLKGLGKNSFPYLFYILETVSSKGQFSLSYTVSH